MPCLHTISCISRSHLCCCRDAEEQLKQHHKQQIDVMRRQLTGTASSARAAVVKEAGPANVVLPTVAAHEAQPRPAHATAEGSGAAIAAHADAAARQAAELQVQQQARHGATVQPPQAQADGGALRDSAAVSAQDWKPPVSTAARPAASHEPQPMALDSPPQLAHPASAAQDPRAPAAPDAAGSAATTAAAPVGLGQAAAPAAEPAAAQEPAAARTQDAGDIATAPATGAAAPAAAQDVDKLLASDEVLPAPEVMQDDSAFPKQEAGMGDDEKHAVAALLAAASGVSSGDAAAMQDLQAGLGAAGQSISFIPDLCNPWQSVRQAPDRARAHHATPIAAAHTLLLVPHGGAGAVGSCVCRGSEPDVVETAGVAEGASVLPPC